MIVDVGQNTFGSENEKQILIRMTRFSMALGSQGLDGLVHKLNASFEL